jgi:addiction module HigA family antidote
MSARALAEEISVPANRVSDIVRGRRGVTADTALRLARYFRTDPRFWLNLQAAHDLSVAKAETDYSKLPEYA